MKIDGEHLRVEDVIRVARYGERVEIDERVMEKVEKARENIEKILKEGKPIYGVNTGFGELANIRIEEERIKELQENLIRSHSCGTGEALKEEVVRAIMLLRLNSLARGMSGVRYDVLEKSAEALNKRFYPYVPSQGSVGASGD
ncbi:MAG TPA: histidine ammonia-lyase, partial [Thermoplasmatales archaeon]|nr:histidine ammonia-lyase [Thermoplasmatales archaeon]